MVAHFHYYTDTISQLMSNYGINCFTSTNNIRVSRCYFPRKLEIKKIITIIFYTTHISLPFLPFFPQQIV